MCWRLDGTAAGAKAALAALGVGQHGVSLLLRDLAVLDVLRQTHLHGFQARCPEGVNGDTERLGLLQ